MLIGLTTDGGVRQVSLARGGATLAGQRRLRSSRSRGHATEAVEDSRRLAVAFVSGVARGLLQVSISLILAHRNHSDFVQICDCDAHRRPQKSLAISETLHCNLRVPWKVASDLRFLRPKPLLSAGFLAIWLRQHGNR